MSYGTSAGRPDVPYMHRATTGWTVPQLTDAEMLALEAMLVGEITD